MDHLSLTCLGSFEVTVAGVKVSTFRTDKVRALLVYLALESPRPHRRERLAALFWPEHDHKSALDNLRLTLHRLRQALDTVAPAASAELFTVTRSTIVFHTSAAQVDILLFQHLLGEIEMHPHTELYQCAACVTRLQQAVDLYQGELLAGFGMDDAPDFEEWLLQRREGMQHMALLALHHLVAAYELQGNNQQALLYAQRKLALDTYREESHQQVMRLLARCGLSNQALAHYESYCRLLREDLGAKPEAETVALYDQIRAGAFNKVHAMTPGGKSLPEVAVNLAGHSQNQPGPEPGETSAESHRPAGQNYPDYFAALSEWNEVPDTVQFHGRTAELAQLKQWLVYDHCRMVTLLGMGGIGKTALAVHLSYQVADHFDFVCWRSLLNAPPLSDILQHWLQILSRQSLSVLPDNLDDQLKLLLDLLRKERCLLILDNVETVLESSKESRQAHPRDAGYNQLLMQVASMPHQSCLLLTSRKSPPLLKTLSKTTSTIRSMRLSGLEANVSHTLLRTQGLTLLPEQAAMLADHYSGNPLALQIVASTIVEWFGGDVTAFQGEGMPIFDDIRAVLDEQFIDLPDLERDLLVWLAIEREAVTATTLHQDLVKKAIQRHFLEALRTLERRSLLTQQGSGFALQNVVIEYLVDWLIEHVCAELSGEALTGDQLLGSALNRYALIKAEAKEYVRQSQERLILQPIASRLLNKLGKQGLERKVRALLREIRLLNSVGGSATSDDRKSPIPGYAAGNLLNLLLQVDVDLKGYDFSHLSVQQVYLRSKTMHEVNFAHADLSHSLFTNPFSTIWPVVYHPDSKWIAGGDQAGVIHLWHADSGQTVATYHGHRHFIYDLAFSPDGRLLASASEDATIRIWNTEGGQTVHLLEGHTTYVNSVAFSPDGKVLASCSDDRSVRLWDVQSGQLLHLLTGHQDRVCRVAFANRFEDGTDRLLASCSDDYTVRLWDGNRGDLVQSLEGHTERVLDLAFSCDGRWVASAARDQTVRLWEVETGELRHILCDHGTMVYAVAFHPTDHTLAVAEGAIVSLWNAESGEKIRLFSGHGSNVRDLAFSPDGHSLAGSSDYEMVQVWNMQGQQIRVWTGHIQWICALTFDNAGVLLAGVIDGNQVRIWDVQSGSTRCQLRGHTRFIRTIAFSPDGRWLLSGSDDHHASVWELQSGRQQFTLGDHRSSVSTVAASHNHRWIASGAFDHTVRLWSVDETQHGSADHAQLMHILSGHTDKVHSLAFSVDDTLLASGSIHSVNLWDVHRGVLLHHWTDHPLLCMSLAFSPDNRLLAGAGEDHAIYLWEVLSGKLRTVLHGHRGSVMVIAFAPDGRVMASGGGDCSLCLWDIERRTLLHRLEGHNSWITAIVFHPDGCRVATGSADGVVKLWDNQSGRCLETYTAKGPYAAMDITGVTGISAAQKAALKVLGAVDHSGEFLHSG